jgi:hypothetical protein
MQILRQLLRHLFIGLAAIVLLFEEWGWVPLAALLGRLARLPLWAWIERRISALPPWGAIAVFAAPAVALFPVKLLALFLIGKGQALMGVSVLVAAKLVGTALLARLFTLTQPALMKLAWFARWYPRWKAWKDGVLHLVRASPMWLAVGRWKRQARAAWADFRRRHLSPEKE